MISTHRADQLERLLRRMRSHAALWGELGADKEAQAESIIAQCKRRLAPVWKQRAQERETRRSHWMYAAEGRL